MNYMCLAVSVKAAVVWSLFVRLCGYKLPLKLECRDNTEGEKQMLWVDP